MALVKCPHCNGDISDKAVKCPHCGCKLSKPTIIQRGNSMDSIPFATVGKSFLAFAILIGGVMCILPLFTDYAPALGYYLPVTYVLVGFGILAGLLSIGLAAYGIRCLYRHEEASWKYWLLTLAFACASAYGVSRLISYNVEAFYDLVNGKVAAVKGTYICQMQDGKTLRFSITADKDSSVVAGGCELKLPDGTSTVGYCDASFYPASNDYEIHCYDIGKDCEYLYANADMTSLRIGGNTFPLKKLSDETKTEEEYKEDAEAAEEAEAQAALDRFMNFRSSDLSALMLHGKVKEVEESNGGNAVDIYRFNEEGRLIEARMVDSQSSEEYKIRHDGIKLRLIYEGSDAWSIRTLEANGSNRLIRQTLETGTFTIETVYSNYDSNNWPIQETSKCSNGEDEEEITHQAEYSEIDEYGNWTKNTDSNGGVIYRSITYYPVK